MFPLTERTIFVCLAGSQAHGTAREGSDVDLRGVCIAPLEVRCSLFHRFEQSDELPADLRASIGPKLLNHASASRGLRAKTECVIFDIAKFVSLLATANPTPLEILFADERDWLLETARWRRLHTHRHRFLTKKVEQTFSGYALAQLKKIKMHRAWLLDPPRKRPERTDFGLPATVCALTRDDQNRIEQSIADRLRSYGIDHLEMSRPLRIAIRERIETLMVDVLSASEDEVEARMRAVATHALQIPSEVVSALNAEKKYQAAMKHWESYRSWQRARNAARAELEHKYGYDTKHATHLVRLMRMGLEVLRSGELLVRRPDAPELLAIRDGSLTYDELISLTDELRRAMDAAVLETSLPDDVDFEWVDALVLELIRSA